MATKDSGNEKIVPLVIALIVIAVFTLYLKKSGGLDEIRNTLQMLKGN